MPEKTLTLAMLKEYNELADDESKVDPVLIEQMSPNTAFIVGSHLDYLLKSFKSEHMVSRHWLMSCKSKLMKNSAESSDSECDGEQFYEQIFNKLAISPLTI